ncbi:hypothetical protein Tco_0690111 [Tanacetum coccineum]
MSRPPAGLAAAADELSPTSYLGPRAIPNLFRGGKVTSGLSSLRLVEGSSNGGDEVGTDMGKGGGIPDDGASDLPNERMGLGGGDGDNTGTGDDTGSGGDTGSDGDGIEGSGGEGIWGSGEDHGESGDDGCGGCVAQDISLETALFLRRWGLIVAASMSSSSSSSSLLAYPSSSPSSTSISRKSQDPSSGSHRHPQPGPGTINLERVGPEERPLRMGPLASQAAQVACRDLEAAFEYPDEFHSPILLCFIGMEMMQNIYACSDSLLLTPLCCDDIHDVTPRVFALARCDRLVLEPLVIENYVSLIRKKFSWGTIFPIGLKRYSDPKEEPIEKAPLMELVECS